MAPGFSAGSCALLRRFPTILEAWLEPAAREGDGFVEALLEQLAGR
jgi:hypothetical protein